MRKFKLLLATAALLLATAASAAAAGGTVQYVQRYTNGRTYWVVVRTDGGYWTGFQTVWSRTPGARIDVYGASAGADRQFATFAAVGGR